MLIGGNNPITGAAGSLQMQCSCQVPVAGILPPASSPQTASSDAGGGQSDFQSIVNYIATSDLAKYLGLAGLGDDTASSFEWGMGLGSTLMAFVLGLGVIIAAKTVLAPARRPRKKWADGAWRNEDYEERSSDYGVRPIRTRRKR